MRGSIAAGEIISMGQNDRIKMGLSHVTSEKVDALAKPHIFCIEGPAGSGKTTLCHALIERSKQNGISSSYIPEFSPTPLGSSLAQFLSRFTPKPASLSPEAEFMHCMADKFASLTAPTVHACPTIVVVDRGFITQAVLGIPAITDRANSTFSRRMLMLTSDWLQTKFVISTLVLNLPLEENLNRLAHRLQRPLPPQEADAMRREREAYVALADSDMAKPLGIRIVDSLPPPEAIAEDILSRFSIKHFGA